MKSEVTKEQIHSFLNGYNPMERIIKLEGDYNTDKISVIKCDLVVLSTTKSPVRPLSPLIIEI